MRYRLILLTPLVWESNNPEKPHKTSITFIQAKLPVKNVYEFSEMQPSSNPGDCAESLYPQLEGRKFRLSSDGDLVEENPSMNEMQEQALNEFKAQYPMVTSGDMQTFILGMIAQEKIQKQLDLKNDLELSSFESMSPEQ